MGAEGRARIEEATWVRSIPCLIRSVASLQKKDPIPQHVTKLYEKLQYLIAELAKSIPSDAESSMGSSRDGECPINNGQVGFVQML